MKMNDGGVIDEILNDLIAELFVYKEQVNTGVINAGQAVEFEAEFIKVAKSKLDQHYASIREEAVIKARIDELKHISPTAYYYDGTGDYELVSDREKRLSDQLKASKREEKK